jgi:hypothetical protein
MTQEQILKKFKSYRIEVAKEIKTNEGVESQIAAALLLAEVASNLKIGIQKQAWEELADELSSL